MSEVERSRNRREVSSCEGPYSTAPALESSVPPPRAPRDTNLDVSGDAGVAAAGMAATAPSQMSPPLGPAECRQLPVGVLEHQARALRSRLERPLDYPGRARDNTELKNVEAELSRRFSSEAASSGVDQGVKICKRTADLPGNSIIGAEHWWLKTPTKEVGMGQADGRVPGHGESGPPDLETRMVDHSKEPKTNCVRVDQPVDVDCVNRELEVGRDTGRWVPGLNDCHTVVEHVVDKCAKEEAARAEEQATRRRLEEADGGVP